MGILMKFLRYLKNHVFYWGENYVLLPFVVSGLFAAILLVNVLTGRAPMEDAGAIVGWLMQALGICIVVSLTGFTQHFLFGYRSSSPHPSLVDEAHDSCVTCFLLLLFSVLVFGLIR